MIDADAANPVYLIIQMKSEKLSKFSFILLFVFRAGDRILLVDDSNDDWWKVG